MARRPWFARNNRGVALILVLWIMLALILLATGISLMARTETQISRNYADMNRCKWAARAGIYAAMDQLKTVVADQTTYLGDDESTITSTDLNEDLGECSFEVNIQDEEGKVNVNYASTDVLSQLFDSSEIADCIADWRDSDDTPREDGAETDYYSSLDTPYKCRNGNFQTVKELELVKGITEDMLTTPADNDTPALLDMLTVYAPSSPLSTDSKTKVDIQSADRESLQKALGSVLSASNIDSTISYRSSHAFSAPADIIRVPGITRSQVQQIYDQLTVSKAKPPAGLININSASASVLAVQPGMDMTTAQAIVSYRDDSGGFNGVGDLLAVNAVSDDAFDSSALLFTTRSSIFKIVSTGHLDKTNVSATITCIVEIGQDGKPKIRYWQE